MLDAKTDSVKEHVYIWSMPVNFVDYGVCSNLSSEGFEPKVVKFILHLVIISPDL